ncbi:MAG: NADP-dependent isocitrate dehydrogenase [Alphaproteobacteria bacterium]|nr:NADP-dependent isocitrate dehydrogenase [Alphaproteobacteria bacterium]
MPEATPITVAYGDGIGPEIMEATLKILAEAKANIKIDTIEVGAVEYQRGHSSGIAPKSWETLRRNKIMLKAPITTPQGGGYKSLNVTMRKSLGLFANVRPVTTYHPFVKTMHPKMDMVIVRENEEDLYAGIEHRQTQDAVQCLKLITRSGSEKIIRYAFEYAVANGRKKVTCMSKDNIMKMADGLFHRVFDEVGAEYPGIEKDHYIIDIGAARIAAKPDIFDVIVTQNLYGDIISDIAAEVSGSVGLAGSSNIGQDFAMFEAIHGSAPDIAGKNMANPSGLLNAAVMMLIHIGDKKAATMVQNAWLKTIEDGIHTGDIYNAETSKEKVGTREFARAVMDRMGEQPIKLAAVNFELTENKGPIRVELKPRKAQKKELVGIDVFLDWNGQNPQEIGERINAFSTDRLKLKLITNRGLKVWPETPAGVNLYDHWRCRFVAGEDAKTITHQDIASLIGKYAEAGLDFIKTEHLYNFDGERGYSQAQGE